ncbi:MAG: CoA transferase [Candidatus Binatus sp.]|uniref:CaiB/BaiF CoA transferase family protein n=1 Tax=Candidatus Binatus sp. TaxID=2811406 RepID=UPI0027220693|nr:CoA transferase [Candidatus Binatus sp.]MDO8434104.1 CoA transferase [Candidatus Binatus sp.]
MNARTGPLSDVRILDLTQALAGPFCTMLLADLGADVIKVEPPGGDMSRTMGPHPNDRAGTDYGGYFASVNRNKRSVVLDIKTDGGREAIFKLAATADAVVENAKTGVMDRAGIGYDRLRKIKPSLVYAAIRGFGDPRTGRSPYADWPAYDIVAQSMGGLVSITGPAGSDGFRAGPGVGDIYPGTLAALGVVSAIHAARRTGHGQFLDVAMYDAILTLCENIVYTYSRAGVVRGPQGNGTPVLCPFDVFRSRDGAVAIAAPGENHWAILCNAIGRPELIADDRCRNNPKRVANAEFVREAVSAWTTAHTTQEIVAAIGGRVPVGPVNTAKDIFADPHPRARGMLIEVDQPGDNPPLTIAGCPIKFTETPSGIYARAPLLGEHTEQILAEAGITDASKEKS